MAKQSNLGLKETKGVFQLKGLVTGVTKDNFVKYTKTKSNKAFRSLNFGVKVDEKSTMYVTLTGMPQDKVYFSKAGGKDKPPEVLSVGWDERFKFNKEGFRLIGVNVGLEKTRDQNGKEVNDKKNLVSYDAIEHIKGKLVDDQSVFVKGILEYSHFTNQSGELKKNVKLIPNQISLCQAVDFSEVDKDGKSSFVVEADFTQPLVVIGVDLDKEKKEATLHAIIVGYNTVENADFIIKDPKLANKFKTLKPYTFIKVWGVLRTATNTDVVTETDDWGEENKMDRVNSSYQKEMIIIGASSQSINTEDYTEEKIDKALQVIASASKANEDFGETMKQKDDDWGSPDLTSDSDEEVDLWSA